MRNQWLRIKSKNWYKLNAKITIDKAEHIYKSILDYENVTIYNKEENVKS